MRDDPDFNILFCRCVEKYPTLYNYNLGEYSNRNAIEKAWSEIAGKLKATVANCKLKWRNIRGSLSRDLRYKPPSGSECQMRKPYYLKPYLQFVVPYTKPRKQSSNLDPRTGEDEMVSISVEMCSSMYSEAEDFPISVQDASAIFEAGESDADEPAEFALPRLSAERFSDVPNTEHFISNSTEQLTSTPRTKQLMLTPSTKQLTSTNTKQFTSAPSTKKFTSTPSTKKLTSLPSTEQPPKSTPSAECMKGKRNRQASDLEDIAAVYLNKKSSADNDPDGFVFFMKSLLPEIKKFTASEKRKCKSAFLNIVNEIAESHD